jgi:threonine dehydrogenase-like Zn-dependent dehydrogenase
MGLIDGAFAEYLTVPVPSLVEVPAAVDDDDAVFAHPVSSALAALKHVQGAPPQRVLVVGDGNMGLLITMLLHASGHTVSVFGRHPSRRDLLWRSGISFTGVHETQHSDTPRPDEFARESFGTVIECSGKPSGFDLAVRALRPRGRLVLVSYHAGEPGFDLSPLVEREIEIVGVSGGPLHEALDYLATSKLDTLPLVSGKIPLQDGVNAFQQANRRGTLKVILRNVGADRLREDT